MAVPCALTAALALLPTLVTLPQVEGLPLPVLLVVAAQLVGLLLAREVEQATWRRCWLMVLVSTALLFPALALATAAAREPFVSLTLGSAGTLRWTTALAAIVVVAVAGVAAVQAIEEPEKASIYFVPAALLVPAVLGSPGNLDQQAALAALAEAMTASAIVVAVAWLAPPGARLLASPVALGGQFAALWLLGYRPVFGQGHGVVAPVATGLLLVLGIGAAVLVPIAALRLRRFGRAAAAYRARSDGAANAEPRAPLAGERGPGFGPSWREGGASGDGGDR